MSTSGALRPAGSGSTYLDHHRLPREGEMAWQVAHSWAEHTRQTIDFLYLGQDRAAQAVADLAAWDRLGRKARAA